MVGYLSLRYSPFMYTTSQSNYRSLSCVQDHDLNFLMLINFIIDVIRFYTFLPGVTLQVSTFNKTTLHLKLNIFKISLFFWKAFDNKIPYRSPTIFFLLLDVKNQRSYDATVSYQFCICLVLFIFLILSVEYFLEILKKYIWPFIFHNFQLD